MIHIRNLTKTYRGRAAVDDVTLELPAGSITALLGPNGAGKSTLIGMMLGQIQPDAGEVLIDGVSVQKDRVAALRRIGATFEAPGFHGELTGWENLAFLAGLSGPVSTDALREAAEFVGLGARIAEKVCTYSRGMRLRLALAQALVPKPAVIILDEPMEGLDPAGIRDTREIIRRMRTEYGATILLSSHLLGEVSELCDFVAVLCRGKLALATASTGNSAELEAAYLNTVSAG